MNYFSSLKFTQLVYNCCRLAGIQDNREDSVAFIFTMIDYSYAILVFIIFYIGIMFVSE